MKEIRKQVVKKLKTHVAMKQRLKVMKFELDILQHPLTPRFIEDQVFAHAGGERVSCPDPRDQTADIVVEHIDSQRSEGYCAILDAVQTISKEVRRLEYYLTLLSAEDADVIRWYYFDGLGLDDITNKANVSLSTVHRRKQQGLDMLIEYYSLLNELPAAGTSVPEQK